MNQTSLDKNSVVCPENELILGISREKLNSLLEKPALYSTLEQAFKGIKPLERGWHQLDGIEGEPVTTKGIEWLKGFLDDVLRDKRIPIPSIYPDNINEGFIIEWSGKDDSTSICIAMDINFDDGTIDIDAINITNYSKLSEGNGIKNIDQDIEIDINDEKRAEKTIEFLTRFFTEVCN